MPRGFLSKNKTQKKAFTLAEVLVALGVIGVVAALTIPTLIKSYEEKTTTARVKKAYATVAQAWNSYIADNNGNVVGTFSDALELRNKFLVNYFKHVRTNSSQLPISRLNLSAAMGTFGVFTTDGIYIGIYHSGDTNGNCTRNSFSGYCATLYIDLNGTKGPNRIGYDAFHISLMKEKTLPYHPVYPDSYTCIKEPNPGWDDGTNSGHACTRRILTGMPRWSD